MTYTAADYNPYDSEMNQDPYPVYDSLRKESPVYLSSMNAQSWMLSEDENQPVYIITGYEEVTYVLEHPELFTSEKKTGPEFPQEVQEELESGYQLVSTLYDTDPPAHTRKRSIVQSGLSKLRVAEKESEIRATAGAIIDNFYDSGQAELFEDYCHPFAETAMLDFIGIPREDHARVMSWHDSFGRVCIPGNPPEDTRQAARELVAYQQFLESLVKSRRANPQRDVLTAIALDASEDGEYLAMAETVWCLMELIGAGYGNTKEGMANVLFLLMEESSRWQHVVENRELAPAAVEEGLRLEGPVHWLPREVKQDVKLGGVDIPRDAMVVVLFAAANRDPKTFPDPHRYDLRRAGAGLYGRHIAHGHGVHYCVGAAWARLAIRIGAEVLMERIPQVRLREGFTPTFATPEPMIRCVADLPVTWSS